MAEKRIKISSIQIKNFRSIRNEIIKPLDFNIFVGINDVGKSNILKALNLFFNNQTDYNKPFNFGIDFSYLFPKSSHSTREIKITIKFEIPNTYSESGEYTWTKVWRTDDYYEENIVNSHGDNPSPKSRVPGALRRIKYRYVPAVKSPNYYKTLLSDLYIALSSSLNNPLINAAEAFSSALKDHTQSLSKDIADRLTMSSELTIPSDLKDIFQALIFETYGDSSSIHVPLTARGDGIQARHIPIILRYIAQVDQKSRNKGSMKVCSIWGFEEPENGLELLMTFQLADEFEGYSNEIQIFTTTHSPAFYMKKASVSTRVFFISKGQDPEDTLIDTEKSSSIIAEKMGLMPLVAPFIAEQSEIIKRSQSIYERNFLTDTPTIMVEGETDIDILKIAIDNHSPKLKTLMDSHQLRIICKNDGGGTTQLVEWAIAWIHSGFKSKLFILLDKDDAGIKAKSAIENSTSYKSKQNSLSMKIQHIEPSDDLILILQKQIEIKFVIEHLLSVDFWKKIKEKGFEQLKSDTELYGMFSKLVPRNKALDNVIDDLVPSVDVRDTILTFNPKKLKKKRIVLLLQEEPDKAIVTYGFKRTIEKLEQYFS